MCSECTVPPDNKETEHKSSSNQEASPSAGKNTGIVLVSCLTTRKCVYTAVSGAVDIPEVPGYHFLRQIEFSVKVTKITSSIFVSWTPPTFLIFISFLT